MQPDEFEDAGGDRRGRAASVYGRLGTLTSQAREVRQARLRERPKHPVEWHEPALGAPDAAATASGRTVPDSMREAAAWSWRFLVIGAVAYVLLRVLAMMPIVTIPFVVALLLTTVLAPVQRWLRDRVGVPHSLAAFLALLVGVGVIGLISGFIGTQVRTNAPRLAEQVSAMVDVAATWFQRGPLQLSDAQVEQYSQELQRAFAANQERLVSGALTTLSALTHLLAGTLLLLLATFFLLRDGDRIWSWALSLLPVYSRARLDAVGRFGWRTLGGFMRGQSIIALLHAITVFVVLVILRVPMATALSVLIFIGSYIPILGMTVTGTLCVVVTLIEHGPAAAIVVAITIIVLIQVEAHLLQPLIMARTVEVHPLGVAMAVLAGTTFGGIAGALFAVPIVAFGNATIRAAHMPLRRDSHGHSVIEEASGDRGHAHLDGESAGVDGPADQPPDGSAHGPDGAPEDVGPELPNGQARPARGS
ncbi:MAG: AI-2E family transporter [Micrococcales bacterium]|nr:AI-2E family transporter [Micrococcales bacterium]